LSCGEDAGFLVKSFLSPAAMSVDIDALQLFDGGSEKSVL
jgi:hypothetical protein